jgi:hypothetical protein
MLDSRADKRRRTTTIAGRATVPTEPTHQSDAGGSGQAHHPIRDGVVAAAVLLSAAQAEPAPTLATQNLSTDRSPTISQSVPVEAERLPLLPEEKDLADWLDLKREQREREAFDLGYALRPPEQVEDRRRDTRPER